MNRMATLRYYSSKEPPTVLVELSISEAEKLVDGHENMTNVIFDRIRNATDFAKTNNNAGVLRGEHE